MLTGASGFVGSHVLDFLQSRKIPTAILIRGTSSRAYLERYLPSVELRTGSITEPSSLDSAIQGITHVIHCAGCTKASSPSDYRKINHEGTAHLVNAVNGHATHVQRLVHISSLAAAGPATRETPVTENTVPNPVSEYGRTKLAAETEVRNRCQTPFTILRPPAVYGPRDTAFLPMFQAVRNHILPTPSKNQELSLVFVKDLAEAVGISLEHPKAAGKTYFVSSKELATGRKMAEIIAKNLGVWTCALPLPSLLLWAICFSEEMRSRLTGRPTLLNLQKFAELRAPGWVCDPSAFESDLGFKCETTLDAGVPETIRWYQGEKWL